MQQNQNIALNKEFKNYKEAYEQISNSLVGDGCVFYKFIDESCFVFNAQNNTIATIDSKGKKTIIDKNNITKTQEMLLNMAKAEYRCNNRPLYK